MKHKIDSNKVFILARKHLNNSSSRSSMKDAMDAQNRGEIDLAIKWALSSLSHSVGIFHADYKSAFNASGMTGEPRIVMIAEKIK